MGEPSVPSSTSQSDFLGRLGHELRTPLNAILGFSVLLQRGDNLTEKQREGLATIEESGQRLLGHINRLLELAEIAPGRLDIGQASPPPTAAAAQTQVQATAGAAAVSRQRRTGRVQPGSGAAKVLVIDDTPANVQLLTALLEGEGLQVLVADNGSLGISLAQRFAPDLILLDVQMRGLGGFETCGALKADVRTGDIPIIFTTVVSDTASKVQAFEAGAADYITKPFHVDEALARVHTQLRLRETQRQLERQNARLQQEVRVRQRAEDEVRRLNAELEARVTERTAQLETANRELQAICHSMAHDLRGPLGAIDGFSALLAGATGTQADPRAGHYIARIRNGIRQMDALTDALLALAHLSLQETGMQDVDLGALARAAIDRLAAQDPGRVVQLELQGDLVARGDAAHLKLLIEHLVGNAWKFTVKVPAAVIELERVDGEPVPTFCIRDNGTGFDAAYEDKLFQPFQRLHRADEFPGVGVGLAMAQRIVSRHGGTIRAAGAVGQGAAFTFTLPG